MTLRLFSIRLAAAAVALLAAAVASAFPLDLKGIDTARTAIYIEDLRTGEKLVDENAGVPLVPASIMKCVTTASVMSLADPEERFITPVTAIGKISSDGVLDGNICINASGDPSIESSYLDGTRGFCDSIVAGAASAGIRRIKGDIVIMEDGYDDRRVPSGWMDEDLAWPYGAGNHGLNYRDNRFVLRLPSRETVPYVPDLRLDMAVRKGKRGGLKVSRQRDTETFRVSGVMPRRGFSDRLAMPRPDKVVRHELISRLREAGIEVDGEKVRPGRESTLLYAYISPTFSDIMKSLMFRSDNMMAEAMLRSLAPGGTRAEALKEERAIWTDAGISMQGVRIEDGSGLSRNDRLTAIFLAQVLKTMASPDYGTDYVSLFPLAGYDGTMRNFLVGTHLEGDIAMKTGSMKGVQSYAGYRIDKSGNPTHIIIFIVNGFTCGRPALKNAISRLLLEKFPLSLQSENNE